MLTLAGLLACAATVALVTLLVRATWMRTYPRALVVASLLILATAQIVGDLLGFVKAFHATSLLAAWSAIGLAVLVAVVALRRRLVLPSLATARPDAVLWGAVVVVMGLTLLSGLVVAPTNYDSLTYHLPRAMHWLQNGDLDFFFTPNSRENISAPLPSIMFSVLLSMSPGAHLVALVQWLAGVVVLVAVGLVTKAIFERDRLVPLAVVFAASVPMFVIMTSTTQTDLLAGVPLAGAAIAYVSLQEGRWKTAVALLSLAIGLAVGIKLTSALLLLPVAVLIAVELVRFRGTKAALLLALGACAGVVVLSGAYLLRLASASSTVTDTSDTVINGRISLASTFANLVRDSAALLQVPVAWWDAGLTSTASALLSAAGVDPSDPTSTFPSTPVFEVLPHWADTTLGAPAHVVLALAAAVALALLPRSPVKRRALLYLAVIACQFALFVVAIRWQPWINRFLFLLLIMAAPLVAHLLAELPRAFRFVIVVVLAAGSVLLVLIAPSRGLLGTQWLPEAVTSATTIPRVPSLVGREGFLQLGGVDLDGQMPPYEEAVRYAASLRPDTLEMVTGSNSAEYPLWYGAQALMPDALLVHAGDPQEGTSRGTVVRICIVECDPSALTDVRAFATPFDPTLPSFVVGRVE